MSERTHNDRTAVEHATAAADALRAIAHLTRGEAIPAPQVYEILGHLEQATRWLDQALDRITDALTDSMLTHQLTDAPGRDPEFSIQAAGTHLLDAARRAEKVADLIEQARTAIADQGYRVINEEPHP